jgi:(5-formylfuran-3-yl)methyl phosphate synthase
MRLLVSVRSAEEVSAALAGGADIIDAKEPERGSLGRVTPVVLSAIAARTPASVPLSVALGDCADLDTLRAALDGVRLGKRIAQVYLKLGFAGVRSSERITALLETAVTSANGPGIVAVGYADYGLAGTPPAEDVLHAAIAARAAGFLVDTRRKDGRTLLDHLSIEGLAALSRRARAAGLLFAVAGSLDPDAVSRLGAVADVLGIRGAACRGGRSGSVDAGRVAEVRSRVRAGLALDPVG